MRDKAKKEKKEKIEKTNEYGFAKILGRFWLPGVVVLGIIAVVLSTVSIYKEEVLNIDPEIEYAQGDGLYFASESLDTLNPIVSKSEDTFYLSKLIYDGLFEYDENFNVVPVLVESYTVDPVKARADIKLKKGIKWHDGSDFSAYDVQFTVNAIKYQGTGSLYYKKASMIYSVVVKDDLNLTVYFRSNMDSSLDDLVFPIVPRKGYYGAGGFIRDTKDFEPVGTGQYKFVSCDPLKEMKLEPNESYFGQKASLNVFVEFLPDKSLVPNMMEISKVTCFVSDDPGRQTTVSDKDFTVLDTVSNNAEFLVFNTFNGIFKNKTARQAAAFAIDTDKVIKSGYMGDAVKADNIYYPGFLGTQEDPSRYAYDRDKARTMFESAGYRDRDMNGAFEDEDGKDVEMKILVNSNDVMRNAAAKLIATDLTAAGFHVNIESLPWKDYEKAISARDFDILMAGYSMEASYDLRTFFNGRCLWKYSNNQMLTAANELERLHTADEYMQVYEGLKELMLDELPYYTLAYKKMSLIGVKYFEAMEMPTFENIYKGCDTWSWRYIKQ